MKVLDIAILIFIILELSNVIILYFFPDCKLGNGVSIFNSYHLSKKDSKNHLFTKYMVNWVAGTKLIFIVLLLVILFKGTDEIKLLASFVMILSIASYFFRLHPLIRKLDLEGLITPKGYSKYLFLMICSFILLFLGAIIIHLT